MQSSTVRHTGFRYLKPFLFSLWIPSAWVAGAPFDPVTYRPPLEVMEVDGDTCPIQFYVAPNGRDTWSGRKADPAPDDGPFATLERAREEIRKLRAAGPLPKGGVAVNLRGGAHARSSSFLLGAQDSGVEGAPVIWRAKANEVPRLVGGRTFSARDFTPVVDPDRVARLDPTARGRVVQLSLGGMGLTHAGSFPPVFSDHGGLFELLIGGRRMPLSRWPDAGESTMKEVITVGDKDAPGAFLYRDERPARWDVKGGVWLKGQWRVGWEDPAMKVGAIDVEKGEIRFAQGLFGGIGNKYKRPKGSGTEPWHALNLMEEITRPGEWSLDFSRGILYLWPPAGFEQEDILITQLDTPLLSASNLAHAAFIGLTLESSLGDGMVFSAGKHLLVAGCTLRNLAGRGVVMDGEHCGVLSCDMYGLGRGCVILSGGDRQSLRPSGNYVINNHLHDYGVLKAQYSAAVDLYSDSKNAPAVGITVAHNLIHHAPRDAVLYAGNLVVFESNEIHRCGYGTADTGSFYSWMDWTIRGVVMRYNHIHDTVGGVNPDDGAAGTSVYGNLFRGERVGVWIASGPDQWIKGNLFVKPEGPVFGLDDRGAGRGYASNARLLNGVKAIRPTEPPWSTTFPELVTFLEDRPELPKRVVFAGNAAWVGNGKMTLNKISKANADVPDLLREEHNLLLDRDPGFIDAGGGNWNLRPDSSIFNEIPDFPRVDFGKAGLKVDRYRRVLPTPAEAGRLPEQDPWKAGDTNRNFGT